MTRIVAKKYFLLQTAALANTTIFTSTEGGDYRLTAYLVVDDASGSSVSFLFNWDDTYRNELLSASVVTANPVGAKASWNNVTVHLKAGGSIVLQQSGSPTSPMYSLYVLVEELAAPNL